MTCPKNQRRNLFANKMHRDILVLVYCAGLVPMVSLTIIIALFLQTQKFHCLGNLISPAEDAVISLVLFFTPILLLLHMILSYKITNAMIGPYSRLVREIHSRVQGQGRGPIIIRRSDRFHELTDAINGLIARSEGLSSSSSS